MSREIPYEQLNGLQNSGTEHGKGVYQKGSGIKFPIPSLVAKAHEKFSEVVQSGKYAGQVIYEYISLKKINSAPTDAMAFPRGLDANVLINLTWDNSIHDLSEDGRKHAGEIAAIVRGSGSGDHVPGYSNYGELGFFSLSVSKILLAKPDDSATSVGKDDKAKLAFGRNYPKLQSIKKKFDPDNIFNRWFPIVPA